MITFKKITIKSKAGLILINYSHAILDQEIQNNGGCPEAAGPNRERFLQPRKYQKYPHRSWLTHWGRVTHGVSELTIIGSDNGLSPGRCRSIMWNNAGLLLIELLGTNFIEISIGIETFSFKKMHLNMSSAKWRPFCLGLNVLRNWLWALIMKIQGYCYLKYR